MSASGWIGVDLDGTLAKYPTPNGILTIGEPIPLMLDRVKKWVKEGIEVRIVTARVANTGLYVDKSQKHDDEEFANQQRKLIEDWCKEHIGKVLKVTASKDFAMIELWDDRVIRVEFNTGKII